MSRFLLFAKGMVLLILACTPAFAQAGGEVLEAKTVRVLSSVGADSTDFIELRLRVVNSQGHEHSGMVRLSQTDAAYWLAGGEKRYSLLTDRYISLFQRLDEEVARGTLVSKSATIDSQRDVRMVW